jgi:hypothetical protein
MPAVPEREMIMGTERRSIVFASEDEGFRTNIGCVNAGRSGAVLNLELFDHQGTSLEMLTVLLHPWSNDQVNRAFADFGPIHGSVEVSSRLATTSYYCYGSVVDNVTNDPTTILPQKGGY